MPTVSGGTVIATAGDDAAAFGRGSGCDNTGTLTLGDLMMVSSERLANVVERENMCWYP
jgi:hypothetical protein